MFIIVIGAKVAVALDPQPLYLLSSSVKISILVDVLRKIHEYYYHYCELSDLKTINFQVLSCFDLDDMFDDFDFWLYMCFHIILHGRCCRQYLLKHLIYYDVTRIQVNGD